MRFCQPTEDTSWAQNTRTSGCIESKYRPQKGYSAARPTLLAGQTSPKTCLHNSFHTERLRKQVAHRRQLHLQKIFPAFRIESGCLRLYKIAPMGACQGGAQPALSHCNYSGILFKHIKNPPAITPPWQSGAPLSNANEPAEGALCKPRKEAKIEGASRLLCVQVMTGSNCNTTQPARRVLATVQATPI